MFYWIADKLIDWDRGISIAESGNNCVATLTKDGVANADSPTVTFTDISLSQMAAAVGAIVDIGESGPMADPGFTGP